ncbi:MAG: preprotein translocase subunit YajC [Microthrixaceae bacterium]
METLLIFAQENSGGSGAFSILLLVGMMGVMYLVLIRPQQKKQREQASFTSSVQVGDRVVTSAGIYGTINHVDDDSVHLEVDRDVVIRVAKAAIMRSQDTPAEPARGGMLSGLLGGGSDNNVSAGEIEDLSGSDTKPTGRTGDGEGGKGKQRPKR